MGGVISQVSRDRQGAAPPSGPSDTKVGFSSSARGSRDATVRHRVRADGATGADAPGMQRLILDGDWEEEGESFRLQIQYTEVTTINVLGHRLGEEALGDLYERIAD
jgi:hypothetical protein